jgi:hypothetical protein
MPPPSDVRKIILLEANEVPFRILDDYVRRRPGSAVAGMLSRGSQRISRTADEALSPWVTWPTLHRGVADDRHGLRHFGQDLRQVDADYPPVWRILRDQGIRTGVFGSLHSHPMPDDPGRYEFYVPDTFAASSATHPRHVEDFQDFNLTMARQSTRNVSKSIALWKGVRLCLASARLGVRAETYMGLARQVGSEVLARWKSTRRRSYQSVLAFDVFMRLLDTKEPRFCTFFTNHIASAMHRYWAALYPQDFKTLDYDASWVARYQGEIGFAMDCFDRMVARLLDFVSRRPEYLLVVASSMGQAAAYGNVIKTQLYLTSPERFMRAAGVPPAEWSLRPSMAPTISVYVSRTWQDAFRRALDSLVVEGKPMTYDAKEGGFFSLTFGQPNLSGDGLNVRLAGASRPLEELGLENVRIEDEAGSTGYHVPEGSLLVYDPRRPVKAGAREVVDTRGVAPAILKALGAAVPGYMSASFDLS